MNAGLRDLYQEVVIDHGRRPRNFGPLPDADHAAEGFNPLCGDRLALRLKLGGGIIQDVRFEGAGCAISMASASLMTEALKGRTEAEAEKLFEQFHALVTGQGEPHPPPDLSLEGGGEQLGLGKLEVLAGVREFPARVKCATLAWHTLQAALHEDKKPVSTE